MAIVRGVDLQGFNCVDFFHQLNIVLATFWSDYCKLHGDWCLGMYTLNQDICWLSAENHAEKGGICEFTSDIDVILCDSFAR